MERLLKEEKMMVYLVEKRGVAMHPWKQEVEGIARYIQRYVKENAAAYSGEVLRFDVPDEIANVFPFLSDLKCHVQATFSRINYSTGGGSFGHNGRFIRYDTENGRIYNTEMDINCYYGNEGKVFMRTVFDPLYHELNHAYDLYMSYYKRGNAERYNKTATKSRLGANAIKSGIAVNSIVYSIIYCLFSETEFNSLVASVYGDMEAMESMLQTFQEDYRQTHAYIVYSKIKNNYIKAIDGLTAEKAKKIYRELRSVNIYLPIRGTKVSMGVFKNAMKKKTEMLLGKLIKEIGRTASLYYEDKYDEKIKSGVPTIIDPPEEIQHV